MTTAFSAGQPGYDHQCDSYGWTGRCFELCMADDRYVTPGGRDVYLCSLHRSPRRLPNRVHIEAWDHPSAPRVEVTWAGLPVAVTEDAEVAS